MKVFEIENICYSYPDGTRALNGISFSVNEGEILGIAGANGSGKSTLLMLMMSCLSPLEGRILYHGNELSRESVRNMRRETGLLFQDPDDQLFLPTVREDVAFGPRNLGLSEEEVTSRVNVALHDTGIDTLGNKAPWKLSGGEKTLAALAGLFAMRPKTLLLDEPTSGLDPKSRRDLINIIGRTKITAVIATHDLDMVMDVCHRVIIMKDGRIASDGEVPGILTDRKFMVSCGLEVPLSLTNRLS
ncbi:MAG: ABC transporter ATP-binding protein [Synergistaceae bacterium]|nr:ABC transporter ATP-binding protein [Synergistaceae bacterium]